MNRRSLLPRTTLALLAPVVRLTLLAAGGSEGSLALPRTVAADAVLVGGTRP